MTESEIAIAVGAGAMSGAIASIVTLVYNSAQERRDRHREHFSRALQAVTMYEEFPYVVRRRKATEPEAERIRISTELRAVQADISYHCGWMYTESKAVGVAYASLVTELRSLVGALIHQAWLTPPIQDDSGMNIADTGPETAKLRPFRERYIQEVEDHLSMWPRSIRRALRWRLSQRSDGQDSD